MNPEVVIPLASIMMIFGIPMAAILTSHQRKMAELIHGKQVEGNSSAEVSYLRQEVSALKDQISRQSAALDEIRRSVHALNPPASMMASAQQELDAMRMQAEN